ncbi:hypothetical protein BGZ50_007658 [Haplosporangium sp. Z 11]|nr:hypothetical protein BGZ50_007658 [Haplosporangium sp. Z 11]
MSATTTAVIATAGAASRKATTASTTAPAMSSSIRRRRTSFTTSPATTLSATATTTQGQHQHQHNSRRPGAQKAVHPAMMQTAAAGTAAVIAMAATSTSAQASMASVSTTPSSSMKTGSKDDSSGLKQHGQKQQFAGLQFSWVHFMAGGIGGMIGAMVTSPLDVVKTRLQSSLYKEAGSSGTAAAGGRTGAVSVMGHIKDTFVMLARIYSNEGPRALYKGLGPTLVGVIPARAINFAAYGNGKKLFTELNHGRETAIVHLSSATTAGITTATMTNPIWVVKTRMQLQSEGSMRVYRNSLHCVVQILKTEGIRGLYKGLSASYLGVAEGTIQWVIYEHLKTVLAERRRAAQVSLSGINNSMTTTTTSERGMIVGGKDIGEWAEFLGAAGCAKFIASAITYPHEVLRTRMRQTPKGNEAPKYTGLRQTFGLILKEEGAAALYGGLTAHMIRVVPNAAIMFFCYEAILHRFG